MLAYLVIREGGNRTDVFRLIPGQTVTIGRAPQNQIVIRDDRCSRYHAEIFQSSGNWTVRDLGSRNGTLVDSQPVTAEHPLSPGEVVRIGRSQLAFVHDLSKAFPDSSSLIVKEFRADFKDHTLHETASLASADPTNVVCRMERSPLLAADAAAQVPPAQLASLTQVAARLGRADDLTTAAEGLLDGVLSGCQRRYGSILLLPPQTTEKPAEDDLEVVVSRSAAGPSYQRVSSLLASVALGDGQGLLAAAGADNLPAPGTNAPHSVVVAPIRHRHRLLGLVHLAAFGDEAPLAEPQLAFALAAADLAGPVIAAFAQLQELEVNLQRARDENQHLQQQLGLESEIHGRSLALSRVTDQITRAAANRNPVLVRGEVGVGKDLVARAIHFTSNRASGPFLTIPCGVFSEEELGVVLFGDPTGEESPSQGQIRSAEGGTLLIDQVDQLSLDLQTRLLCVLEGEPLPLADGTRHTPDVRIIATTAFDLEREIAEGRFRHDLFVRLQAQQVLVPALHRRSEDIPELARYFLQSFTRELGRPLQDFTPAAIEALMAYRWPGNVRELKNTIERAAILARGPIVDRDDLLLPTAEKNPLA